MKCDEVYFRSKIIEDGKKFRWFELLSLSYLIIIYEKSYNPRNMNFNDCSVKSFIISLLFAISECDLAIRRVDNKFH